MEQWWKNAVGYQIYPRSFKDSNGDGIGDLQGIIEKLPYLKELGVDFLWLNPIYTSPNVDNGYDIADYQGIQPEFGTMEDFQELLDQAHQLGLKIILDLVVNHTSDQHPWFVEAKKSLDNPYREYYLWADATPDRMPNEWQSFFGGSTWTYDAGTKQAYFHVFAKEQPDLNWKNPKVREEIYAMIRWWLDLGIDGFRLDAISHIQKEPWDFKITTNPWAPFMNVKGIEDYMLDLKAIFAEYDIMTVGEASGVSSKKAVEWTNDAGYLNMIFELEHNVREGKPGEERLNILGYKKVMARWQKHLGTEGWNALYVENHDNPRINSILGNETSHSAKAIGTIALLLRGTPFIYQGQEIGMVNYPFQQIDELDAKDSHNHYRLLIENGYDAKQALKEVAHWTRDHSRTPMQWTNQEASSFTSGHPWLAIHPNFKEINVADQETDAQSVLNYYKKLIALRKDNPVFTDGQFELLAPNHPSVFAFLRKTTEATALVIVNLSGEKCQFDLPNKLLGRKWQQLLGNQDFTVKKRMQLAPYQAGVFR
ncbi:alpha-glucosidase [Enterococcus faecalis]|uniref:glycoside hydrolase family 13 protein n=1 Tax=Enterococcus TaxID=1350 RepID=UPI00032FB9D1|nr:alpha-glucosidase [Enterococcus faecalis]EGO8081336.1 alpha-glucosidase [Enterococcus faecalis]EJI7155284.1 alpha-glucosidase [Enterococcus faecalis]ELU9008055.1 alpha-glucosidase [Enterococcus faecalis]EOJ78754.1 alpha-glucosidase [Enterococcus faecalis EnGen0356]MDK0525287.1 alpha-glucosidase [Enterococcus faecalis]